MIMQRLLIDDVVINKHKKEHHVGEYMKVYNLIKESDSL